MRSNGLKGAVYYEAIATVTFSHVKITIMLFSHVQISSFRAKAHLVFHWCLYNKIISTLVPGYTLWPVYVR